VFDLQCPVPEVPSASAMEVDDSSPDSESRQQRKVVDNWEDAADGTTPDEEDVSEETVMRIKKKPQRPEETKSKKEHVNIVFIGHVGECLILIFFTDVDVHGESPVTFIVIHTTQAHCELT